MPEASRRVVALAIKVSLLLSCSVLLARFTQVALRASPPLVPSSDTLASDLEEIRDACGSYSPYYAISTHVRVLSARDGADQPAIVALRDTPGSLPSVPINLALQEEVGATFGLAYDTGSGKLYAAAYNKRATAFGPGGPGQVYEIDLASGAVRGLVALYAGEDAHDYRNGDDSPAAWVVGRNGLGDIEVDEANDVLYVTNLADGLIYRIGLPSGQVLGTIANGAAAQPWARNARPFALAIYDGWLYHGVVDSGEFEGPTGAPTGHIYRSRPNGLQTEEVARFAFDQQRPLPWSRWTRNVGSPRPRGWRQSSSQPMLTDLGFTRDGAMVIGVRDRVVDMLTTPDRENEVHPGTGDLLVAMPNGAEWEVVVDREAFPDKFTFDESVLGSLAPLPGFDQFAASAFAPISRWNFGLVWYEAKAKSVVRREEPQYFGFNGLGDVEVLCRDTDEATPEAARTATSALATATEHARATATAAALTPDPRPTDVPDNLVDLIAEACVGDNPFLAGVCYPAHERDDNTLDAPAVVVFRDTPDDNPLYMVASGVDVGAVWGLAYRGVADSLYASAFHKVGAPGHGAGVVFRIDLRSGTISRFAELPNAAGHATPGPEGDNGGRDLAGKSSLGDLELSSDGRELFVVNLLKRLIYAIDATTGEPSAGFEHGASAESWAADARPFGLKVHGGLLYHGIVNSAESSQQRGDLEARVYSSALNGSGMKLVAEFPLDYPRGVARLPGLAGQSDQIVPLDWQPWRDGLNDIEPLAIMSVYPQPLVSDIEFAANGDMLVALRDRHGDMAPGSLFAGARQKAGAGLGEVVRLRFNGNVWDPPGPASQLPIAGVSHAERGQAGGLASMLPLELVVANQIRLTGATVFGDVAGVSDAVWYDRNSNAVRREWVCRVPSFPRRAPAPAVSEGATPGIPEHNEWIPAAGAGDLEVLCDAIVTATPTSYPTDTPRASATPQVSATPTPWRPPPPIYLPIARNETTWPAYIPIALKEECQPGHEWADIVLVIDTSSSMAGGKLADAKAAAISFVGHLSLSPGHNQVAVVRFDTYSEVVNGLTSDGQAAERAIRGLAARSGTHIDLGLLSALEELRSPRRNLSNAAVIVLLTDGIQTGEPGAELEAAREVRGAGVRFYTIGMGADVDERTLVEMAGERSRYYFAPDSSHLLRIYREVAHDIDCPATDFWGQR